MEKETDPGGLDNVFKVKQLLSGRTGTGPTLAPSDFSASSLSSVL